MKRLCELEWRKATSSAFIGRNPSIAALVVGMEVRVFGPIVEMPAQFAAFQLRSSGIAAG